MGRSLNLASRGFLGGGGLRLVDVKEIDVEPDPFEIELEEALEVALSETTEIELSEPLEIEIDG